MFNSADNDETGKVLLAVYTAKQKFGPLVKDKSNDYFNAKYADLESLLDVVEPPLMEQGVIILQPTVYDGAHDAQLVRTMLVHVESGQFVESTWKLVSGKQDSQGYGSALTYARRYCLQALLGIAPEDDDGNATRRSAPAQPAVSGGDSPAAPAVDFIAEVEKAETIAALQTVQKRAQAASEWVAGSALEKALLVKLAKLREAKAGEAPAAQPSGS